MPLGAPWHPDRWTAEDGARPPTRRHLRVLLATVTLGCVAIAAIAWASSWPFSFALAAASTGIALVAAGLTWVGRERAASILLVSLMLGAAFVSAAHGDGLHDVALTILPAAILVSSLLLGRRATAVFALTMVASLVGMAWYRRARGVATPWDGDWLQETAIVVVALVVVTLAIHLLVADLVASVRRAQESEARYRGIFLSTQDAYCEIGADGALLAINPAAEALLGDHEEHLLGLSLRGRWLDPSVFDAFAASVEGHGRVANYELSIRDGAGAPHAVLVNALSKPGTSGEPHRIAASMRDVTERRALRERLAKIEQLETVGALAGGIAHDFNNLVNVIRGQCEIARRRAAKGMAVGPSLEAIERAATRGRHLVQSLLAFARRQPHQPRRLDLNDLVAALPELPDADDAPPPIEVRLELGDHVPPIMADPSQIEQILANLVGNARQAVRARHGSCAGGRISITTRGRDEPVPSVAVLEVRDNGQGMSDDVRRRIFEPFFTTRAEGTGLGLASVFGIVRQNHATIDVESQEGQGSTFRVLWPAAPRPSPQPEAGPR